MFSVLVLPGALHWNLQHSVPIRMPLHGALPRMVPPSVAPEPSLARCQPDVLGAEPVVVVPEHVQGPQSHGVSAVGAPAWHHHALCPLGWSRCSCMLQAPAPHDTQTSAWDGEGASVMVGGEEGGPSYPRPADGKCAAEAFVDVS